MTLPTITALPTAPSRTDPATFAARGDAFVAALATLRTEINSFGAALPTEVATLQNDSNIGQLVQLGTPTTITGSPSTVDFIHNVNSAVFSSTYDVLLWELQGVKPGTDGTDLVLRTTTDAGSSWDSGATDYGWARYDLIAGSTSSSGAAQVTMAATVGNATDEEGAYGRLFLFRPSDAKPSLMLWNLVLRNSTAGAVTVINGAAMRKAAANVDGLRLFFSSGTMAAGVITMYGRKKS